MFRTFRPFSRTARSSRSRPVQPGRGLRYRPGVDLLEERVVLATHWVLNTADAGPLSLRQAILDSNSDLTTPRFIKFSISSGPCSTISPLSPLPPVTQPVTIDGTTEPGSGGLPAIQLNGSSAGVANGLLIQASDTEVKGLVINSFAAGDGILISRVGAVLTNDVVTNNYIGTDCTGTTAVSTSGTPLGNGNGVVLTPAVTNSLIGRIVGGAKNVISGNGQNGIVIGPGQVTGIHVEGNYVGTDVTGTTAFDSLGNPLGNNGVGVLLLAGATSNTIGGGAPLTGMCDAACNLVSGNLGDGISLFGATGAVTGNMVHGNYVGTDVTGTTTFDGSGNRLGNGRFGVLLYEQASNNTAADNLLSGNFDDGLIIAGSSTATGSGNVVQGNFVGTDRTGTTAFDASGNPLGNLRHGVSLHDGAQNNTVGGIAFGAGNVISGNAQDGIHFDDEGIAPVGKNLVEGNYIGTDVTGTLVSSPSGFPLGNGFLSGSGNGVDLAFTTFGDPGNTIGGTVFGAGNVISGNVNDGVLIAGTPRTISNLVQGNYIGTDVTGTLAVDANGFSFGNGNNGVEIAGPASNLIGGTVGGAANVIANNGIFTGTGVGVLVSGSTATGNGIRQNSIYQQNTSPTPVGIVSPFQPPPVLMSPASYVPGTGPLTVLGTVAAPAGSTLEFFANNTPPSTDCEGQLYLGSAPAAAAFTATLPGVIPPGYNWVSATVTTPTPGFGNTSPFSNCVPIAPPPPSSSGALFGRISSRSTGSLVSVGTALSAGVKTVADPMPQSSVEAGSALVGRAMADWVFGNLHQMVLAGSPAGEELSAGLPSRLPLPLAAGWDILSDGELNLFGS